MLTRDGTGTTERYQSERPKHGQPLHICQAKLHQTQANNDSIKNIPALLKIVIGIHGNDF